MPQDQVEIPQTVGRLLWNSVRKKSGSDEKYGESEFASGGEGGGGGEVVGGYNQQKDRPGLSLRSRTPRAAARATT